MKTRALALLGFICGCGGSGINSQASAVQVLPPIKMAIPPLMLIGGTDFGPTSVSWAESRGFALDGTTTCNSDTTVDPCVMLTGHDKLRCNIKQRLFCPGPTEILRILDGLNSRIVDINHSNTPLAMQPCMATAPADHTADLALPGGQTITTYLGCADSQISLGFGELPAKLDSSGTWYYRLGNALGGWVFTADHLGNVDGYLWGSPSADGGSLMMRIQKTPPNTLEITGAAVSGGFCALQWRSDGTNVWILINGDGVGRSCDTDLSGVTDLADYSEICLDYTTIAEVPAATCDSLKNGRKLTMMGRGAFTSMSGIMWEAAAPLGGSMVTVDMTSLTALGTQAGTVTGLTEWKH